MATLGHSILLISNVFPTQARFDIWEGEGSARNQPGLHAWGVKEALPTERQCGADALGG